MNQEAADMQNKEAAEPEQDQNYSKNQKHNDLLSFNGWPRLARLLTGHMS
jgi:hypothetical protein